jgi:hypothetical protein
VTHTNEFDLLERLILLASNFNWFTNKDEVDALSKKTINNNKKKQQKKQTYMKMIRVCCVPYVAL